MRLDALLVRLVVAFDALLMLCPSKTAAEPLFSADPPGSYALPSYGPAPDFDILDVTSSRRLRLSDLAGRAVVLSFFYTRCGDGNACPLATAVLRSAERLIDERGLARRVALLSITFDEAHDTPEVLRSYRVAARADAGWRFATPESATRREALLRAYDQRITRAADGSITHPLRVYLIDPQQRLRQIYSQSFLRSDVLLNDLQTVLGER